MWSKALVFFVIDGSKYCVLYTYNIKSTILVIISINSMNLDVRNVVEITSKNR